MNEEVIVLEEKKCLFCGCTFLKNPKRAAKKYCSPECSLQAVNLKKKIYREKNKAQINQKDVERKRNKRIRKAVGKYSNKQAIINIDALAKKEGLSYGMYVAKYGI